MHPGHYQKKKKKKYISRTISDTTPLKKSKEKPMSMREHTMKNNKAGAPEHYQENRIYLSLYHDVGNE